MRRQGYYFKQQFLSSHYNTCMPMVVQYHMHLQCDILFIFWHKCMYMYMYAPALVYMYVIEYTCIVVNFPLAYTYMYNLLICTLRYL